MLQGAYRRALEIDPYLVPAIINLANIHYARDEIAEAQALTRAITLEPDVFEAHFNLGNIFHDLGRYTEAQICYRDALRLNPTYADAPFLPGRDPRKERAVTRRPAATGARINNWRRKESGWTLAKEFSD